MAVVILALTLSVIAGLADVLGGYMVAFRGKPVSPAVLLYCTAASAGFMLGVSLLDRIPDTFQRGASVWTAGWLLSGFLLIYIVEQVLMREGHQHHHGTVHEEPDGHLISRATSLAAQWGLMLHTCLDGVAIGAGFSESRQVGILMFLAVVFHKMPEGFSLASTVLASGRGSRAALQSVWGIGVMTVAGTVAAMWFSSSTAGLPQVLVAIATGSFLYISTCGLLSGTQRAGDRKTVFYVLAGLVLFIASFAGLHALNLE